jgi:hypothetical protein
MSITEAVEAVRASGRQIEPIGDDFPLWLVEGVNAVFSDEELIVFADRLSAKASSEGVVL